MLQAALDGRKARVGHQVGAVQRAADVVEELVVERGDLHVAPVPTAERPVRRIERAGVADARLHVVGEEELADLRGLDVNQSVHQTHLDLLADALLFARPQSQHGGERDQIGAGRVGNRRAGLERPAATLAGHAHETRQRLGERVDAGPARVRPILAEGADRDTDDRGVVGARFLVAHAELGLGLRTQIVDHDVRGAYQPEVQVLARGFGQVDDHAAFVAVDAHVHAAVVGDLGADGARLVAVRRFDLDDLGAHVPEHGRSVRRGQHASDVQHANPVEGERHACLLRRRARASSPRGSDFRARRRYHTARRLPKPR